MISFWEEVVMALPSESQLCRKCGGKLMRGFVRGEAQGLQIATIEWVAEAEPDADRDSEYSDVDLAPLPLTIFGKEPNFPALLCPTCRIVEFHYE
jgi:hypothetical protein